MKQNLLFPLGIIFIVLILFVSNFSPNLWLSGWDNLHPEFSFDLNIKRSVFAVWQEYQGLGLLGGMGHASDLPRQIFLYFSSFIFPKHLLRQLYFFLMLLLGPLGMYFLLNRIIIKRSLASFAGSIFYLLNLATIQTFYTSFEPFATHFGFLPFLFFAAFTYINSPNFKSLFFLIAVNLFAVPQAYVQTIFLVYFLALGGSLIFFSMKQKDEVVKRSVKVLLVTLFINAFWLLPSVYFVLTSSRVAFEAKINQMTTENVFLLNKNFGDLADVVLLKGFWFDYRDFSAIQHNFGDLLIPWKNHFNNIFVPASGFLLFAVILIGIFFAFRQKNNYRWILLFLFLIPVIILANNTPPFSWIDSLLYRFSFLSQSLRSPFTKFSILAAFSYSIFFAFGINSILNYIKGGFAKVSFFIAVFGLIIFFTFPVFRGDLFYKQIKVAIPQDYLKLWDFFNHQNPNTRIAHFPIVTFWGWDFYSWGYSGSGFLWYGLKQPILNRAFDVWSSFDENYYWEISYALYSKNKDLFEKVLEKYQVNWLMIDESVLYPSSPKALFVDELEQLISTSHKVILAQSFGKIKVYKVNLESSVNNFVFLAENLPNIQPEYKWTNLDQAYLENGNYISIPGSTYYPFRSLFTGRSQEDLEFSVEDKNGYFIFRKKLPQGLEDYYLDVPEIKEEDLTWVDPNDLSKFRNLPREVYFDSRKVEVAVPKVGGLYSFEIEAGVKQQFWLQNTPHKLGFMISVGSKNLEGKPFNFWIENLNSRRADLETYLPRSKESTSFFIQPPMEEDGLGYALHFDQIVFGAESFRNKLGKIKVYPIPFNFLMGLKLKKENSLILPSLNSLKVEHHNPSMYSVTLPQGYVSENPVLVLSQSYDKGWIVLGKGVKDHVLVNNWENGWVIDSRLSALESKLIIIYLPQILQFLGLFLAASTVIALVLDRR